MRLVERIKGIRLKSDQLAIWYLGQAGFCLKTFDGVILMIDPYLSDYCYKAFGFKRMIPAIIHPDEIVPDLILVTHKHGDHLDPEALPYFSKNRRTFFIIAADCVERLNMENVSDNRRFVMRTGEEIEMSGSRIRATYADHGNLAPDAVGYEINIQGIRLYFAGDTGFCPEKIISSLSGRPDIMIAPINGAYGNLNSDEACKLATIVKTKLLIGSHVGMFIEHGGDPAGFLDIAKKSLKGIHAMILAPGEEIIFSSETGLYNQSVLDPLESESL